MVKVRFRRGGLGKGRAEDAARCIFKHSLPADNVRYERPLAQLSGQSCGAATGEHDQLQLAGEHMRPHRVDERSDGHGLRSTTLADKGEDELRLKPRIAVARKAPRRAALKQSAELRDADVAAHLSVCRSAKGRLDGGGFGVDVREVGMIGLPV